MGPSPLITTMKTSRIWPSGQRTSRTPCQELPLRPKSRLRLPMDSDAMAWSKASKRGADRRLKRPPSSRISVSPPQPGFQSYSVLK